MLERLREMIHEARSLVTSFEPGLYSGSDAVKVVEALSELKKVVDAGILKAAIRAEETRIYERDGHTGAGSWLSGITGEPVGSALGGLEAMRAAKKHPFIEEALTKGDISVSQARQITKAADAFPERAADLLDAAGRSSFDQLKRRCEEVKFGSHSADEEISRHERIRRQRSCRTWVDIHGGGHLEARITPDALAVVKQGLDHFERQVLGEVKDRTESIDAYRADALVAMTEASLAQKTAGQKTAVRKTAGQTAGQKNGSKRTSASRPLVRIRVDLEALKRGHALPGETCAIPGIGPVAVEIARSVLGDALLELVITNGTDVPTVVTDTRSIRKALRVALEERDGDCCVPGCATTDRLETDHFVVDFSKGGPTEIKNLAKLCGWHHYNKTHKGWRLGGGPGHWRFVAPDRGGGGGGASGGAGSGGGGASAASGGSGAGAGEDESSQRDALF
jgi:hypothetical protein